jgi:hypothetical protein
VRESPGSVYDFIAIGQELRNSPCDFFNQSTLGYVQDIISNNILVAWYAGTPFLIQVQPSPLTLLRVWLEREGVGWTFW